MSTALGLLLALIAYTLLSAGLVGMKKGIGWIGRRKARDERFRRNRRIWLAGFFASNLFVVPNALALDRLPPHIVSAMAGWGVIVLVRLSRDWLDEPLRPSDPFFSALIVAAIAGLNLLEHAGPAGPLSGGRLAAAVLIPAGLALPACMPGLGRRRRALLFAAVSGMAAGLIVICLEGLIESSGFRFAEWLSSPILYLNLACSLGAFISLQVSYKLDAMLRVGPVQYAGTILYPAVCSWWVFGNRLSPLQWVSLGLIALGAAGILNRR